MTKVYLLLILLVLPFSSHYGQNNTSLFTLGDKELSKNANAIIRSESTRIEIASQRSMNISYKKVITVLNKRGNKLVNAYAFYDGERKIKTLEARVFNQFGKEIKKIKKKDFKDVSAVSGGTLYSDSRVKYLEYTPVSYPYTLEFIFEVETSTTAFISPWQPLDQYCTSIEKNTYEIINHTSALLNIKSFRIKEFDGVEIKKTPSGYRCVANNIKAVKREDYSPSLTNYSPKALFSISKFHLEGVDGEMSDWATMGRWQFENLVKGRDKLPEATTREIRSLTDMYSDPIDKARVVYQYVQDRTRYISVQVGIGGWMPIDATTVDEVKYGDCKGLTNYTKALLSAVGVNSNYTIVYGDADEKLNIDKDFASMQGNHVILNIPTKGEDVWLECTSQVHPFGFLGDFTDDRNVLVVNERGGQIKRTPSYDTVSQSKIKTIVQLKKDLSLEGVVQINSIGIFYDNRFYLNQLDQKDQKESYQDEWSYLNNLSINTVKLQNDKDNVGFQERIAFRVDKYGQKMGARLMFEPLVVGRHQYLPDKYSNRRLPLKLKRSFKEETQTVITIPPEYEIESIPKNIQINNKFGEYALSFSKNKLGEIHVNRILNMKQGDFPKEDYVSFRSFKREIIKHDQSKVVLKINYD